MFGTELLGSKSFEITGERWEPVIHNQLTLLARENVEKSLNYFSWLVTGKYIIWVEFLKNHLKVAEQQQIRQRMLILLQTEFGQQWTRWGWWLVCWLEPSSFQQVFLLSAQTNIRARTFQNSMTAGKGHAGHSNANSSVKVLGLGHEARLLSGES